jgi:hypothetical protein
MRRKTPWIVFGVVGGLLGAQIVGSVIITAGAVFGLFLPKWGTELWVVLCIAMCVALWIWFIRQCVHWGTRSEARYANKPGRASWGERAPLWFGILLSFVMLVLINLFATAQLLRSKNDCRHNQQEMAADSARRMPLAGASPSHEDRVVLLRSVASCSRACSSAAV